VTPQKAEVIVKSDRFNEFALVGVVGAGAIGGGRLWFVLNQVIPFHWVMPIVFFSPPVLCLLLGGFAGYRVACRRAARRTGA
jgi:hypothetical protein